jgi:glycosyltransferase involved in cell wall biosynthesis
MPARKCGAPQISIVVPAYNAERYLAATVDSVLCQTCPEWELVLVDDGSTDATPDIASAFATRDARIRLVRQDNMGMAGARNSGFGRTNPASQYIVFLDADDTWEPDALALLVSALEAQPSAVGAHGLYRSMDALGRTDAAPPDEATSWGRPGIQEGRVVCWSPDRPTTLANLVVENCIATPGQVLIRRLALAQAGGFDSRADLAADWDMWLRLALIGDFAYVATPILRYRRHSGNASRRAGAMSEARRYVRRKFRATPDLTREQYEMAAVGLRWYHWHLSRLRWRLACQCLRERQMLDSAKQLRHAIVDRAWFHILASRLVSDKVLHSA